MVGRTFEEGAGRESALFCVVRFRLGRLLQACTSSANTCCEGLR